MPGYFISFDDEGQLVDEAKLKTKDRFSQFEIQLVSLEFNKKPKSLKLFLRLHMDLVFNLKKMKQILKHLMKPHLHHIGQQLLHQIPIRHRHKSYRTISFSSAICCFVFYIFNQ